MRVLHGHYMVKILSYTSEEGLVEQLVRANQNILRGSEGGRVTDIIAEKMKYKITV